MAKCRQNLFGDQTLLHLVMSVLWNMSWSIWIPNYDISIRTGLNDSLLWIAVENLFSVRKKNNIIKMKWFQWLKILNQSLAAFVEVTATNLFSSMIPLWTPFVQITAIRSLIFNKYLSRLPFQTSTPFTPLGIFLKSSLPSAFWLALKVQLSVPVHSSSPQASC